MLSGFIGLRSVSGLLTKRRNSVVIARAEPGFGESGQDTSTSHTVSTIQSFYCGKTATNRTFKSTPRGKNPFGGLWTEEVPILQTGHQMSGRGRSDKKSTEKSFLYHNHGTRRSNRTRQKSLTQISRICKQMNLNTGGGYWVKQKENFAAG